MAEPDHAGNCCRLHGCLLDGKCPVEVGGIVQNGPCVLCPEPGKVGWDNQTAEVLRCIAGLIDENSAAKTESPWATRATSTSDSKRSFIR